MEISSVAKASSLSCKNNKINNYYKNVLLQTGYDIFALTKPSIPAWLVCCRTEI